MKRVAVAMATYNGEAFIERQLRSILHQSRAADSVIISDDCSTDNTTFIVESFIRENRLLTWQLIVNSDNVGFVDNYRRALRNTDADIVFLCDQDDLWRIDKLEKMLAVIEKSQTIMGLASSFVTVDKEDNEEKPWKPSLRANFGLLDRVVPTDAVVSLSFQEVLYANPVPGCTCAFRRDVVQRYLSAVTASRLPHDWVMVLLAIERGKFLFFNSPLTLYRLHGSNTIGLSVQRRPLGARCKVLEERCRQMKEIAGLLSTDACLEYTNRMISLYLHRINTIRTRSMRSWITGLWQLRNMKSRRCAGSYMLDLFSLLTRPRPRD